MGSKEYKYKNIIALLVPSKKVGTGINKRVDLSRTLTLNDNKINYIYWNDLNEIVDRLRLLEASHQADIEELRKVGLIINSPRFTHVVRSTS